MNNIIKLNNIDELENKIGTDLVKLGIGAEGIAYLSKKDNKVYKILTDFEIEDDIKDIITTNDIELKYFLLPEEVYIYDNHIIAYKTKYIDCNLFNVYDKNNNIHKIDFDIFIKAYNDVLKEIKKLSENNIKVYDIGFNIMFDGKNMFIIDTCGYRKSTEPSSDIYNHNKYYFDDAIKDMLSALLINEVNEEKYNNIVEIENLEEQLKEIKKTIKK